MTAAASSSLRCHACGTPQVDEALFCSECGVRLKRAAPVTPRPIEHAIAKASARASARARKIDLRSALVAATVLWIGAVALYAYSSGVARASLDFESVWDLGFRALVPPALMWLAAGYLSLASKLRATASLDGRADRVIAEGEKAAATVAELVKKATAAVRAIESEMQKLRDQERVRMRGLQPRWEVSGHMSHDRAYEINLRNAGAPATQLSATWDKSLPLAVILSETALVERGATLTLKAMFLEKPLESFKFDLQYCDGANQARTVGVSVGNMDVKLLHAEI